MTAIRCILPFALVLSQAPGAFASAAPPDPTAPQQQAAVAQSSRQGPQSGSGQSLQPAMRPAPPRRIELAEIPVPVLASALGLTATQRSTVDEIRQKLDADLKALQPKQGAGPGPAGQAQRELLEKAHASIDSLLTPDQKARVAKLSYRLVLLGLAGIPLDALADMNLTSDEMDRIGEAAAGMLKDAPARIAETPPGERIAKTRQALADLRAAAVAILTPDQKQKLEEYRKTHPLRQANAGQPPK
jgi:hypothetical protein